MELGIGYFYANYKLLKSDFMEFEVVAPDGIEPPTQGFSILCSTN